VILDQFDRYDKGLLSIRGLKDIVSQVITAPNLDESHGFYKDLQMSGRSYKNKTLADNMLAAIIPSLPLYSAAITQLADYFLADDRANARQDFATLAAQSTPHARAEIGNYMRQALYASPPVTAFMRTARDSVVLVDGTTVNQGDSVYCNLLSANNQGNNNGAWNLYEHGLLHPTFFEATAPQVLRAIFSLKHLSRAPGDSGVLNRAIQHPRGDVEYAYVDFQGQITPWPASMAVQYYQ